MKLLVDSHVLLWYDDNDRRLREDALQMLRDSKNTVYVSVATHWELTIKRSLGKLDFTGEVSDAVARASFISLPVMPDHVEAVGRLPRHHGDPFDHLLIAQALLEGMTLMTHDKVFTRYSVPLMLV